MGVSTRARIGRVAVALGQGRPADDDAALARLGPVVQAHLDAVQGHTVIHAAPGGLAGAVRAHHPDPGGRRTLEHRPRRGTAAEEDRVQFGQRGGGGGVEQRLGQLGGHQRRVAPAGAQFGDRRW